MLHNWKIINNHTLWYQSPNKSPFFHVNIFSFCIDNRLFLIDSGPYPFVFEQLIMKLPKSWSKFETILMITHHDFDHSLGYCNYSLPENSQIFAHSRYFELLRSVTQQWLSKNQSDTYLPNSIASQPTHVVSEEQVVSEHVMLIPTPGHTADSISIFESSTNALFVGDSIEIESIPFIGESGDIKQWINSIELIIKLNPSVIYPGHGAPIRVEQLQHFKQYLDNLVKGEFDLEQSILFKSLATNEDAIQIHFSNISKCE